MASGAHTSFRADLKPLRNKYAQCQGPDCEMLPEPGQKLAACSACRVTVYCSKECQKRDWKYHKTTCMVFRAQQLVLKMLEEDPDPVCQSRYDDIMMLQDFWTCYKIWLETAVYIMRQHLGRPLDFRQEGLHVELHRIAGPEGNPATRYRLENISFVPSSTLDRFSREGSGRSLVEAVGDDPDAGIHGTDEPLYVGCINVLMTVEGRMGDLFRLMVLDLPEIEDVYSRLGDDWMDCLKDDIARGIVPRVLEGRPGLLPGMLVKEGHYWNWKEVEGVADGVASRVLGL